MQCSGGFGQQQVLAKWGYASINTGSVQRDNGSGFTSGIIRLVNKGTPRTLEDWGVLRAWVGREQGARGAGIEERRPHLPSARRWAHRRPNWPTYFVSLNVI